MCVNDHLAGQVKRDFTLMLSKGAAVFAPN